MLILINFECVLKSKWMFNFIQIRLVSVCTKCGFFLNVQWAEPEHPGGGQYRATTYV